MTDPLRGIDLGAPRQYLGTGDIVLFRHFGAPDRLELGEKLRKICNQSRLRLVVAGDVTLAAKLGAWGHHLPSWQLYGRYTPLRRHRPGYIVTAAVHNLNDLRRAMILGVDAILLSPVFPTESHPGGTVLGLWRAAALVRLSRVDVYALGGITKHRMSRLNWPSICGVAGVSLR